MNIALHGMEESVVNFMQNLKIKDNNGNNIIKRRRASSINIISMIFIVLIYIN